MRLLLVSFFLAFAFSISAQSPFADKKTEKLYYKLDDAYLDYDYATILDEEEKIKELFLTREDTIAANAYSFLAEAYDYELGDAESALDFYNLELELREKIEPEGERKDLLFNISTLNTMLGYFGKAESILLQLQVQEADEFGKNSVEYFEVTSSLIELYNQTEQAENIIETVDDLSKYVEKNTVDEALTYKWLGDAYIIKSSFKKGERALMKGVDIFISNGLDASLEYVSTLNSLGILYTDNGKFPEAEEVYQEALDILNRMSGDVYDFPSGVKENLAQVYGKLGDYEKALDYQQQVIEFNQDYFGEESLFTAIGYINSGIFAIKDGKWSMAESQLQQSISILEAANESESIYVGRARSRLSELYVKTGNIDQAIEEGKKSIDSYKKNLGEDHWETSKPTFNLANAYLVYDYLEQAEELAMAVNKIRGSELGKKHPLYAQSTNQLAILNWKKGNFKEAKKYYEETFKNYFGQINAFFPVLTEEEKATFYYTKLRPAFEQYITFIAETSREDKELLGEIYDYQLALKGLIMYATAKVRESILSSGDEALIEKYEQWVSQKEQMAKLYSASEMKLAVRNKKIDSLTELSNNLEEQLSRESDVFGKNFANKKLKWQDVQKTLKEGEAAVEMVRYRVFSTDSAGVFTDEVHYAAMIVRHDTEDYPEMVIMRNGAEMEKKYLSNYRNAIKYKISENYSYRLFWRPISNRLDGIKRIYFAPDGVYNQVSIYTLQNPATKDYLLNEIDLYLVTNTKDLIAASKNTKGAGKSVFFGFPNYNMGANEGKDPKGNGGRGMGSGGRGFGDVGRGMRSAGQGSLERGASIPRGIRGNLVRYMQSFNGLAMLPGTEKEVNLIDSLYTSNDQEAETYLLEDAVENRLKEIDNPKILHIATHGFFLELDPEALADDSYVQNPLLRSGLVLAGANSFIRTGELDERQGTDDGILTAFEAMNLNLDQTDIVVLSACETGLGEIKNGEGVYGLQRAFQIAGADAIIMSMWTVDDAATQELMTIFYEEWLQHGDKRLAFNTAQKRLREKYKKPYYWGAFVMIGG